MITDDQVKEYFEGMDPADAWELIGASFSEGEFIDALFRDDLEAGAKFLRESIRRDVDSDLKNQDEETLEEINKNSGYGRGE